MIPLLVIGSLFLSLLFPEEQSAHFTAPLVRGEKISLQDLFGDLVITGTESDTVDIQQFFSAPKPPAKSLLNSQLTQSDTVIIFKPANQLNQSVAVQYHISIPSDAALDLDVLGGSIQLLDMRGILDISMAGGDISINNFVGTLSINTGGGSVQMENIVGDMVCNTGGGVVSVSRSIGPLRIFSGGGDITVDAIQGSVTITTLNGSISISDSKGAEMRCKTGGGNIAVEKIDMESIHLGNTSGDISMKNISGAVLCKIDDGDLSAEDISGQFELRNLNGNSNIKRLRGSISVEEVNGNIKLESFNPVSVGTRSSSIYCQNGNIILDYFGEHVSIEALSYQGQIVSNILSETSKYPAKAAYLPEVIEHEITIESKNGKIIVNKRRRDE
ncbi:MAG: DUF4097 domain-containing protein [FCB group bacterium]|nr:DUF4097 domain-containing protein [FCB group bacterium]